MEFRFVVSQIKLSWKHNYHYTTSATSLLYCSYSKWTNEATEAFVITFGESDLVWLKANTNTIL